MTDGEQPIRDASTIVLLRQDASTPRVLMGQRGKGAVFMPNKFVFPGGRVDDADHRIAPARPVPEQVQSALQKSSDPDLAIGLTIAAIRELWEETGLRLGSSDADVPSVDWPGFADTGLHPDASALRFFFRAVTPPGRPRRFDARFFLAPADAIDGDIDDFRHASDELSHLQWVSLDEARGLELPFVTRVVLSELEDLLADPSPTRAIPFFAQGVSGSRFDLL